MKQRINVTAAAIGGVALLAVLGGVGCSSSGSRTMTGQEGSRLAGVAWPQSGGASHGSVVSPLGDAPGERDMEMMSGWAVEPQPASRSQVPALAHTAHVR